MTFLELLLIEEKSHDLPSLLSDPRENIAHISSTIISNKLISITPPLISVTLP
jgi:hypothetical protein